MEEKTAQEGAALSFKRQYGMVPVQQAVSVVYDRPLASGFSPRVRCQRYC